MASDHRTDYLTNAELRLLLLILAGKSRTVRGLAKLMGYKAISLVSLRLRKLKAAGLISFLPGKAATIQPACYLKITRGKP